MRSRKVSLHEYSSMRVTTTLCDCARGGVQGMRGSPALVCLANARCTQPRRFRPGPSVRAGPLTRLPSPRGGLSGHPEGRAGSLWALSGHPCSESPSPSAHPRSPRCPTSRARRAPHAGSGPPRPASSRQPPARRPRAAPRPLTHPASC